jgi:antitoxin component YwqK of YwqJK toxin-antitoxin module
MKNILSILLVSVILFGCDTKTDDPIESRYHIDKTIEKNQTFCLKSNNQKITGVVYSEYHSGRLKSEMSLKNGLFHGLSKAWYANGQLNMESNYYEELLHGMTKNWYENGQLENEQNYRHENKHGLFRIWYKNGAVKTRGRFEHNNLISIQCWDIKGNKISCN